MTINNLKPKLIKFNDYKKKVKMKTNKIAKYYNKKTKILKPLTVGKNVYLSWFLVVPGLMVKLSRLVNFQGLI